MAEVAAELGCDSLAYLSLEGVYEAIGAERATHCDACFTGQYPLAGTDGADGKHSLEGQLPLVERLIARRRTRRVLGGRRRPRRTSPANRRLSRAASSRAGRWSQSVGV